jgi:transketolase
MTLAQRTPSSARPRRILRDAFGQALVELGTEFPNMVVLDADISGSLKTGAFRQRFPQRHINFGTAEQDMLMAAGGLSTTGLIPLACTYATFATMRACEQIRSFICYSRLNVKVMCSHGGLEVGWDGPTHQATEDVAFMRAESQTFSLGKAITLREGSDLTIIAMGVMLALALDAADTLADRSINARVLDMHTVKPLDGEAIDQAAQETGAIVTAEDHNILGGLGGAVAEYLVEHTPVPMKRVGVPDTFGRSGDPADLFPMYGMAASDIVTAAHDVLARKKATGRSLPPVRGELEGGKL